MSNLIGRFGRSLKYALRGIRYASKHESSFQIQLLASLVVVSLILYFQVKTYEIIILVLVIAIVLVLELLNTVLEKLIDVLKPRFHDYIRVIKDLMAAAVLIASLVSIIIGLLVFIPYFRK